MAKNPGSWRIHESTIARVLYREDLAGHFFFGKKVPLLPGEAAVWLHQGKAVKIVTKGQKVAAGVGERLKDLFSSGQDLMVMILDTQDILLHFRIGADKDAMDNVSKDMELSEKEWEGRSPILTKDGQSAVFDVRLTLNLLPEKAGKLFDIIKDCLSLEKEDLAAFCRSLLEKRFFGPAVAGHTLKDLGEDLALLSKIHQRTQEELSGFLSQTGVHMERIAINPALTAAERMRLLALEKEVLNGSAAREKEREAARLETDFDRMILRDRLAVELEKAILENDQEKQKILRAAFIQGKKQELSAARIEDKIARIRQETALAAKEKEEQLRQYGIMRDWEVEKERMRSEAGLEMEKMRVLAEEHRKNKEHKARLKLQEMEFRNTVSKTEQEHVERILELGAHGGVLTEDLLREAVRQGTIRKAIDEGGLAAQAFAEAEAQRFSTENFRQGLLSQPPVAIMGQGVLAVRGTPADTMQKQLPEPQDVRLLEGTVMTVCPSCGRDVPDDSVFCGYCGNKIIE